MKHEWEGSSNRVECDERGMHGDGQKRVDRLCPDCVSGSWASGAERRKLWLSVGGKGAGVIIYGRMSDSG